MMRPLRIASRRNCFRTRRLKGRDIHVGSQKGVVTLTGAVASDVEKLAVEGLARGKTKMQALVATMRELPHAVLGMSKHDQIFQGSKVYALANASAPAPQEVVRLQT